MRQTSLETPIRPPRSVAELHSEMVAYLANIPVPPDPATAYRLSDQAASLRQNADYLARLQCALEPVIRGVVAQAVRGIGLTDVTDAVHLPSDMLNDEILSVMKALADDIDEQAASEMSGRHLPWFSTVIS